MNTILKQEGIKLGFSLIFILMFISILYFALPKITEKAGVAQAKGFWRNEVFENRKRLFGNDEEGQD